MGMLALLWLSMLCVQRLISKIVLKSVVMGEKKWRLFTYRSSNHEDETIRRTAALPTSLWTYASRYIGTFTSIHAAIYRDVPHVVSCNIS